MNLMMTAVLLYDDCRHNWLQRLVLHTLLRRQHLARWLDEDPNGNMHVCYGNMHVCWAADGVLQIDAIKETAKPVAPHFEHEPDCVLGKMEQHPSDRRPCWRCTGRWVE